MIEVVSPVASGTYAGNDTENRAIPHTLGVTPKLIIVTEITTPRHEVITPDARVISPSDGTAYPVTVMTSTNFYVGNSANYTASANHTGITYYWVAIRG